MYDRDLHHRRSVRLCGYDYSQAGAYFVTICAQNKDCLFGEIVNGEMKLNDAGQIVTKTWDDLAGRFPSIALDAFVVMPNHVHGIITIVGAQFIAPKDRDAVNPGAINRAPTVGEIVRTFKAVSTRMVRRNGLSVFSWQRNYYEHVIRGEGDLESIREYVTNNPARWVEDHENPGRAEVQG